jgi:hypothetical protein
MLGLTDSARIQRMVRTGVVMNRIEAGIGARVVLVEAEFG